MRWPAPHPCRSDVSPGRRRRSHSRRACRRSSAACHGSGDHRWPGPDPTAARRVTSAHAAPRRWPERPNAVAHWRIRHRTTPWLGRGRGFPPRRRAHNRRSSAARAVPRRTCWSAHCPGPAAQRAVRSSPRRSSPGCLVADQAPWPATRRYRGQPQRAGQTLPR
ncbi:Uncharacterised protein [Mycobacterium tuberculosis]|nr:Uncharacterised protein [Mycobacterium tuberculosis]